MLHKVLQRVGLQAYRTGAPKAAAYSTVSQVQVKLEPYKLHGIDNGPSNSALLTRDEALKFYRDMKAVRKIETSCVTLYQSKQIRGFCHLYAGQEACCVGMEAVLRPTDAVITAYRAHGWTYVRGVSMAAILSELTGKRSGCSKGKGGSMHMYGEEFYGGNGIVGAQVPLGAGIALAMKYNGTDNICLTLYGDGAANQGQVFEAYNMAKLWNLPCIFICENNKFGMGTSAPRSSASTDYYSRGDFIPGIWVDGTNVVAVKHAAEWAADWCRSGRGPLVMELDAYRFYGHSMSDNDGYRTKAEKDEIRAEHDPIELFKKSILEKKLVTSDELKALDKEVKEEVSNAIKQAKDEIELPLIEMYNDIYAQPDADYTVRGSDTMMYPSK